MLKKTLIGCMLILFIIVFSAQASEEVNYDFGRYGFDNTIGLDDYEYLGMVEDVPLRGQNGTHSVDVAHFRVPSFFPPGKSVDRYGMYDFRRSIAAFDAINDPSFLSPRPLLEALDMEQFFRDVGYDVFVGYDEILWKPGISAGNKTAGTISFMPRVRILNLQTSAPPIN